MSVRDRARGALDRVTAGIERGLRLVGDPRLGLGLLLVAAAANIVAAAVPAWRELLDAPPYVALIGAILLTGIAAVAIRAPAAWREWRDPVPVSHGRDVLVAELRTERVVPGVLDEIEAELARGGYRIRRQWRRQSWALAGVRHGWSRFAALTSHLAMVLLVVGAAIGTGFAEETRFGLFPGEQSLLAAPRPGVTAAVRLDRLDARFDTLGRAQRFDTYVTFLRDGQAVRSQVLRVNEPGDFDGYLVHAWTYGPAVTIRIEDLGGGVLFDGWIALGGPPTGSRAPFVELPQLGTTIGFDIADAAANTVRAIAADDSGRVVESAVIGPAAPTRVGPAMVTLNGFASYVTFFSRRDPGAGILFAGAVLLVASLVAAFYFPRRTIEVSERREGLRLRLRGGRFDLPRAEMDRLAERLRSVTKSP